METPAECESEVCSPQRDVPAIMEAAEGQEVVPSSPPPSYEYVLKEVTILHAIIVAVLVTILIQNLF